MFKVGPGSQLGSYEVVSALGAGGMGEVYRAHDTKLAREVAIKIVHPRLSHDREHLSRFRREAHILAALNHPHIASIFELNEIEGTAFLVMELVEGETLFEKFAAGPLTIHEILHIASQIAGALEAAHEKGIVHRDLKPANVKLTPTGIVKVLDFGLAKTAAVDSTQVLSQPPTGTGEGVILGTAAYMSPEQARAKPVDRRADIWAFGCIMFEALTNHRPFGGETVSDTIAGILEREPDWQRLPATTPPAIVRLIRRCLEKDVNRRLRDIGDARLELEEALAQGPVAVSPVIAPGRGRARLAVGAVTLLLVGGAIGGLAAVMSMRRTTAHTDAAVHFVVALPEAERLTGLDFPAIAIAPDASMLAYAATRGGRPQLFVRSMSAVATTPVPGTQDASSPFFSPDGRWIAFFAGGKLKKVPVGGGAVVTICDAPVGVGGTWGTGDLIVFAGTTGSGLSSVAGRGGTPTRMTTLDTQKGEFSHRWPELLPDGNTIMFAVGTVGSWDDADIVAASLKTGERKTLVHGGTNPHYFPTGHLLYARGGALMAVPFDAQRFETTGTPVKVLDHVLESFDGAMQLSVSASGSIVYVPGSFGSAERALVTVARDGSVTPVAAAPAAYVAPRVSPEGRRLAVIIGASTTEDLWIHDVTEARATQLTFDANSGAPVWTPDGRRVAFSSSRTGAPNLFWIAVDGSGADERLALSDNVQLPGSWSPDGRVLAFVERSSTTGRDILLLSTAGDRTARALIRSPFDESAPRFSPDGRWIAYVSNESGRNEVYACPLADPARKHRVSDDGGAEPVWARNGRELFYRAGDRMMAVSVDLGSQLKLAEPRLLFQGTFDRGTLDVANFDVNADGQFVMIRTTDRATLPRGVHVVLNWSPTQSKP